MNTQLKPIMTWFAAGLISVGAGALSSQALAATAAGTDIKNLATVTYEDAAGNTYRASSNESVVTVQQIYSATIETDNDVSAAPGSTIYIPHVVTNTGNGQDVYTLTFADGLPAGDGRTDTIDSVTLKLFDDANTNGTPDAGETEFTSGDTITLLAGETMNLIVGVGVPATANMSDTLGITLTAEAHNAGGAVSTPVTDSVTDVGTNNDSANGTNADVITVTNNAVIDINKASTHLTGLGYTESSFGLDLDNDATTDHPVELIEYVVTVANNGNTNADNVTIFDGQPANTAIIQGQATLTQYNPISDGLFAAYGDTTTTYAANIVDETSHGVDLDQDGSTEASGESLIAGGTDVNSDGDAIDDNIPGLYAVDAELPSFTSVSMTFYVAYSPAIVDGDVVVRNSAYACSDLNGDGDTVDTGECADPTSPPPSTSNPTEVVTETTTGVDVSDTGTTSTSGLGGDDDNTVDDTQTITTAPTGSEFFLYNKVANNGNKIDMFDVTTPAPGDPGNSFPAGTTFSYWNATGTAQLVDNNSNSIPDTGPVPSATCLNSGLLADAARTEDGITLNCNEMLIRVVVRLPPDAHNSTAPFNATTTITSTNDPTISASKTESLTTVSPPTVDVANQQITPNPTTNVDPVDVTDGTLDPADIATVFNDAELGQTLTTTVYITNEGGSPDSFTLTTGGSYDVAGTAWLADMPTNWTIVFKDAGIDTDSDGTVDVLGTNTVITTTPPIPANGTQVLTAEITVPLDPIYARAQANDSALPFAAGEQASAIDANSDGDNDYIIYIQVTSAGSGATDIKVEAIDIRTIASIDYTPTTLSNQIEAGGGIAYEHFLSNTGNTREYITLDSANDKAADGFDNTLTILDNDTGQPIEIGNLCDTGDRTINVVPMDGGAPIAVEVQCDASDGTDLQPNIQLEPGESIPLLNTVFAPTNATAGTVNKTTLTAVVVSAPTITAQAEDNSEVIAGQLRLYKYVDLDANCDSIPDSDGGFQQRHSTLVEPGQCIIWKLVAVNEGTDDALNVVVTDELTEYTTFLDLTGANVGELKSCRNSITTPVLFGAGTYSLTSDNLGPLCNPDATSHTAGTITQGVSGSGVTYTIGTLEPGDKVISHFSVTVD
ncbi:MULTISPECIES: hypothetical protein [unclassified Photobacterium]|uniref:beta strand repeat-containing protein n=1 Tax=unclassified Photobacterium TaxID=2628852 RepID=UPI001E5265DE|nr:MULTISPECIES: hypothetical protein [unclassified Photobacterium]